MHMPEWQENRLKGCVAMDGHEEEGSGNALAGEACRSMTGTGGTPKRIVLKDALIIIIAGALLFVFGTNDQLGNIMIRQRFERKVSRDGSVL